MKKLTIITAIGIFIAVTAFLGTNNEKMYQKQKHFETTSEILDQLESKQLKAINEKGNSSETNDLKECFSERKRATELQFYYDKMEVKRVEELNENQKQSILKDYNLLRNNFTKRRVITKEEPVRLNVTVYNSDIKDGTIEYFRPRNKIIDLVFIDEGEGLVVDYIMEYNSNKLNEEENKDA